MKKRIDEFLKKYNMHYDSIDLEKCCNEFIDEMDRGLKGETSSLMMLPTYISIEGDIPTNEPIIVMDAGGTNLRIALVYFDNNKLPIVENFKVYPMLGTKGTISKEQFFDTIVEYLEPIIDKSDKIGFCFSFPTEILPNRDGKLIRFNKEVDVRDMEGVEICKGISEALISKGHKEPKKFVLLNDTVATMLGGIADSSNRSFDSFIGFILGTGTNTCYSEQNSNILKVDMQKSSSMVINMESGGYSKLPLGDIDREFDSTTINPNKQLLEKKISGAYHSNLIFFVIKQAIKDKLFSDVFVSEFEKLKSITMPDINDFCYFPYGNNVLAKCCNCEEDREALYYIIDASFERAAKIATVNLASIMIKTGKGKNPNKPICIVAEGTTFYKAKLFRTKLDYYIKDFVTDKKGIYCEFIKSDNATLTGTAIAGLLNQ